MPIVPAGNRRTNRSATALTKGVNFVLRYSRLIRMERVFCVPAKVREMLRFATEATVNKSGARCCLRTSVLVSGDSPDFELRL